MRGVATQLAEWSAEGEQSSTKRVDFGRQRGLSNVFRESESLGGRKLDERTRRTAFRSERRPSSPGEGRHRSWPREKTSLFVARQTRTGNGPHLEKAGRLRSRATWDVRERQVAAM